jgi:hypothetical protein
MKRYTFVVHYLQMCMKEYGCCPKFKRRDNCVKFHKNSISSLVGVALTRYMPPPPFRESISWIISPFKFWTATIFLHAHLQVVYYKFVKFHKNPISGLGGVALTSYTTPLFVKVWVELSPLLNFRQQQYSFMYIYRLCTTTVLSFIKIQ